MENAKKVVAGAPVSAAEWNKIVDRINAGTTATVRARLPKTAPRRDLLVYNAGTHTIPPCGVAEIDGFKTTFADQTDATNKILNGAVVLNVVEPRQALETAFVVATEPIAPGKVGEAKFCGGACFYALRSGSVGGRRARVQDDRFGSPRYFQYSGVDSGGDFRIVAESEPGKIGLLATEKNGARILGSTNGGADVDADVAEIAFDAEFALSVDAESERATVAPRGIKLGRYEGGGSVSSNETTFYVGRLIAGNGIAPFETGGAIAWSGFDVNGRAGVGKITFSDEFLVQYQSTGSAGYYDARVSTSPLKFTTVEVVTDVGRDSLGNLTTTKKTIRAQVIN